VSRRYGEAGLPDDTITMNLSGSAGQSMGFALAKGVTINLEGEANDYVGKSLSGGKIVIRAPERLVRYGGASEGAFASEDHILVGNTCLYGAITGEALLNGRAGERFCVRNSGATAVIEGMGDHGCEYMTGGRVVVLGNTGRNFGAGMSGGLAYVYDPAGGFPRSCNMETVGLESGATLRAQVAAGTAELWVAPELARLRALVQKQADEAESGIARELLLDWEASVDDFVFVVPNEYRAVLNTDEYEQFGSGSSSGAFAAFVEASVDDDADDDDAVVSCS